MGKRTVGRQKKGVGRCVIEGTATVRTADSLHATLAEYLKSYNDIEIDCSGITEADLTIAQLLLAARKSAKRDGKRLVLTAEVDGALRDTLAQAGFLPAIDGKPSKDETFWLVGKEAQ